MPTTDESSSSDLGTYGYTLSDTNTAFRHGHSSNSFFSSVTVAEAKTLWTLELQALTSFSLEKISIDLSPRMSGFPHRR